MQETEQLITLYHTGFIIFLILTILFAALSVLLFFLFKIRRVFDYLTGRAEKRTIRQMEEETGDSLSHPLRSETVINKLERYDIEQARVCKLVCRDHRKGHEA